MKKLNKKGFTLIELLAVVVILLAISIIAVSSISAAMERNKAKQDEAKKDVIVSYAELYYDENKNSLEDRVKDAGGEACIDVNSELKLSDAEMKNSAGEYFNGCVKYKTGGEEFEYIERGTDCCS